MIQLHYGHSYDIEIEKNSKSVILKFDCELLMRQLTLIPMTLKEAELFQVALRLKIKELKK